MTKSKAQNSSIRIIGGDWRGRKLEVLNENGLRPTSDRVRETLFNWLQFEIAGMRCLDLFAGTGALGLEALSRGAKEVVFIEKSARVAKKLSDNLALLNGVGVVKNLDALDFLTQEKTQFDLIFIDPPFHKDLASQALALIEQQNLLAEQGKIYLELENSAPLPAELENYQQLKYKTTSQTQLGLWQK